MAIAESEKEWGRGKRRQDGDSSIEKLRHESGHRLAASSLSRLLLVSSSRCLLDNPCWNLFLFIFIFLFLFSSLDLAHQRNSRFPSSRATFCLFSRDSGIRNKKSKYFQKLRDISKEARPCVEGSGDDCLPVCTTPTIHIMLRAKGKDQDVGRG